MTPVPPQLDSQLDDLEAVLTGIVTAFLRLRAEDEDHLAKNVHDLLSRTEALVKQLQDIGNPQQLAGSRLDES